MSELRTGPPIDLPPRRPDAHKGDFGRCLLVGGSRGMAGSIALSSIAALRMGAGLVTVAVPDACLETVAAFHPCLMTVPLSDHQGVFGDAAATELIERLGGGSSTAENRFDVVACGPGMTTAAGSVRIVDRLLRRRSLPRVFDADAINVIAGQGWLDGDGAPSREELGPVVLTPHPGELQRLTGVPASDRGAQIEAASELSRRTGIVIVVKGGPTVVVGDHQRWTNTTGNPGMATAGSGDVLTGIVASLLGQKGEDGNRMSPWDAARLGVYLHGRAGDVAADRCGQAFMLASDVLEGLRFGESIVGQQ